MKTLQEAYAFCPCCAAALERKGLTSMCNSSNCGHREYFNPRPSVSAVLFSEHSKVLLTRRAQEPCKGFWEVPGGFQHQRESLEDTLRREVTHEELKGLVIKDPEYLHSEYVDYPFGEFTIPVSAIFFMAEIVSLEHVCRNEEVSAMCLFRKEQIPWSEIGFTADANALRKLLNRWQSL